jgi:hypothetical protein
MWLPRVRFTVRRMMVAVAVLAISMAAGLRWFDLRSRARAYAFWAAVSPVSFKGPKGERLATHYDLLRLKYEWAARYPWLPVAPDPPEPE